MPPEEKARFSAGEHALTHRRSLGARLYLQTWIRLLVALTIAAGALFARLVVRVEDLDVVALLVLALAISCYNAVFWLLTRTFREADLVPDAYRRAVSINYLSILLDFLALSVAIWLVGGARSPFLAFYLLHVILSGYYLSQRAAIGFTLLAYTLLALMVAAEWSGVLPPRTPVGVVGGAEGLDGRFYVTVLVAYGMLFGLTTFLMAGIARVLRQSERRIWLANAELARQADRRRDYLLIALHDLKAPIGAATMFLKNLREGLGGPVTDRQREWLDRSLARIRGLTDFIQSLLVLSSLDEAMIRERVTEVDLVALLRTLVEENREVAAVKEQSIELELPAGLPPVSGIERLVREAVLNYLTNAVKFTPPRGRIKVRARDVGTAVRIEVEDSGPGIPEESRETIFREFTRSPRRGGEEAGKSTGLGLSIVRRVAEALGGSCGVESAGERGSVFHLDLPIAT